MEPKLEGLIDQEQHRIERDVYAHLAFQVELAQADDASRQLMLAEELPIPEEYLMLRKLRTFSGPNGGLPFLVEGAYYDQPYCLCLMLEAALSGERKYEAYLKQMAIQDHGPNPGTA